MATTTAPAAHATAPEAAAGTHAAAVSLDAVEATVADLLAADKRVLKLAADLPFLFRVPVSVGGKETRFWSDFTPRRFRSLALKHRWGSRLLTRLYVETHVRRQLDALRRCLRLELLGTTAEDDRARLEAMENELANRVPPLLGWRRLAAFVARIPALAAAVPVVWAASVVPLDDVAFGSTGEAVLVFGAVALGVWVLVVSPAVKLGFRVKRAIFAGGQDVAHPFMDMDSQVVWSWFEGGSVYDRETAGFKALGRRKPSEPPLDMLLSFVPYVAFALLGLMTVGLVDSARNGFEGASWDTIGGLWLVLVIFALPFLFVRNAWRNHGERPH
jgi:hypothetical protein